MIRFAENYSLKQHNTFGIDVKTRFFLEFNDADELVHRLKSDSTRKDENRLFLGGGSNLLFVSDFDGLVLHPEIQGITRVGEDSESVFLEAGAGVTWDAFAGYCVESGLGGAENLSLIPGNIGAVPVQNIGAYGQEASGIIDRVRGIDMNNLEIAEIPAMECRFGYRDSIFKTALKGKFLITSVWFRLAKKSVFNLSYGNLQSEVSKLGKPSLAAIREAVIRIRSSKLPDPAVTGNAGSFFKNPVVATDVFESLQRKYDTIPSYPEPGGKVKLAAGWLIDQCGWKGYRSGDAGVHEKQALVLVNHGKASGLEIFELSEKIRDSVIEKFGVALEREVLVI